MLKRIIYIGNPAHVSLRLEQMQIELKSTGEVKLVPLEDLGVLVLDHSQITLTNALLYKAMQYQIVVITCNEKHMPEGLALSIEGNVLQQARYRMQIEASKELKAELWQQTIKAKITNQASLLEMQGCNVQPLIRWAGLVEPGDPVNLEGRAAAYYWRNLFPTPDSEDGIYRPFIRDRNGDSPNQLLNYAYAVLRALVARSLVVVGLLPSLGIHHQNQYNAFCLADDIMEPYRPYADQLVHQIIAEYASRAVEINQEIKTRLLSLPLRDIYMDGKVSPLMAGVQRTANSLVNCFEKSNRKLLYPTLSGGYDTVKV